MKICIFTSYFYPEDFKVNDIAFELANRNHEVTVITAVPNYPKGKFFKGYSLIKRRHEVVNNVEVFRLPVIPRGKGSGLRLGLNYLSHLFFTSIFTYFYSIHHKFDVVFVHQGSPVTIGLPAIIMSKKQKIPMFFWVLDLWPESVVSASNFRNNSILILLTKVVKRIYKASTNILISSEGFKSSIIEKGDFKSKIEYFPNWAESVVSEPNVDIKSISPFSELLTNDFIIMFAGNLGEAQDLRTVIEAAKITKNISRIKWLFIGDGRKKNELIEIVNKYNLNETVFFPGRFPLEEMPNFMSYADIMLVSLKDELIFNLTVPAKVQFYMSQSKPIIAMLNGSGAVLVNNAKCGFSVPAGNSQLLAEKVISILKINDKEIKQMATNGKEYYETHFRKEDRISQLENLFMKYV